MSTPRLKAFPRLDLSTLPVHLHSRSRSTHRFLPWFAGVSLAEKLARALFEANVVPFKEVLESFEFFEHVRRRVRAPTVVDLCCGHGLVGMLYGIYHRDVETVRLVDRLRPESVDRILAAVHPVAPWLAEKVRVETCALADVAIAPGSAVLGVHACGSATDAVIDVALAARSPVALLPCCHQKRTLPGPPTLGPALGLALATDVHRTYRLHAAGYQTRWTELPEEITVKNRVIEGWPVQG